MREEAGHLVETVERDLPPSRDGFQFHLREVSATFLDLVQLLDDRSVGRHRIILGVF
jgi:hypothetical protein